MSDRMPDKSRRVNEQRVSLKKPRLFPLRKSFALSRRFFYHRWAEGSPSPTLSWQWVLLRRHCQIRGRAHGWPARHDLGHADWGQPLREFVPWCTSWPECCFPGEDDLRAQQWCGWAGGSDRQLRGHRIEARNLVALWNALWSVPPDERFFFNPKSCWAQ